MGTLTKTAQPTTSIADALFTKTQQRVLTLLFGKPDTAFYTNEILRFADMGRGTVRRELEKLTDAGLLVVSPRGNQRYYQANPDSPIYQELVSIVSKTFGLVDLLREAIEPIQDNIDICFVYGSIAKGEATVNSDVDLMIIAENLAYSDALEALGETDQSLGRELNPTILTKKQFRKKIKQQDAFVTRVMEQPKLWVKGGEDDLGKPG